MNSEYEEIEVEKIELDLENPRIQQFLEAYKDPQSLTSEQIAFALHDPGNGNTSSLSYNTLKESIKVSRGIIHPIIVNREISGRMVVIEGNTRLQIYKEKCIDDPNGPWHKIRAIVYDNLSEGEIHAIRLQSHLVGPREWSLYSKAKYINQLSNIEHRPMSDIISMCGGKKSDIDTLINAYQDFERHFVPLFEPGEVPTNEFSKFKELQNKNIKRVLRDAGYSEKDFAQWVFRGHVDRALDVRELPDVIKNPEAKAEFLKTTLSNAIKKLAVVQAGDNTLKKYPAEALMNELIDRFDNISFKEVQDMSNYNEENSATRKRKLIFRLSEKLAEVISYIKEKDTD